MDHKGDLFYFLQFRDGPFGLYVQQFQVICVSFARQHICFNSDKEMSKILRHSFNKF